MFQTHCWLSTVSLSVRKRNLFSIRLQGNSRNYFLNLIDTGLFGSEMPLLRFFLSFWFHYNYLEGGTEDVSFFLFVPLIFFTLKSNFLYWLLHFWLRKKTLRKCSDIGTVCHVHRTRGWSQRRWGLFEVGGRGDRRVFRRINRIWSRNEGFQILQIS